jgi:hypothetical protein
MPGAPWLKEECIFIFWWFQEQETTGGKGSLGTCKPWVARYQVDLESAK